MKKGAAFGDVLKVIVTAGLLGYRYRLRHCMNGRIESADWKAGSKVPSFQ